MTEILTPSDEDLIRIARLQPQSCAFEQLIKRHQSRLRLYLRSLTGNIELADELAQETLMKVHRSLSQFKFESSFKTWVMAIARNTFLDHARLAIYRGSDNGHFFLDGHSTEASLEVSSNTEDQQIFALDLNQAFELLSSAEREVIAHCYFADLSMKETAMILKMPLGTVKTHSHRALIKLRENLHAWNSDD
jgi:RNA polymerase sigma factor (sigma-70 family)